VLGGDVPEPGAAENRGWITQDAPTHRLASIE